MQRAQLVRSEHDGRKEVFEANFNHPEAETLQALLASETSSEEMPAAENDERVKAGLVALGAPLRGVAARKVPTEEQMNVLARGVELARRDPTVARTLPLCFWRLRDQLDAKELESAMSRAEDKHALAFFLELTGELGGDRRLVGLAENLRDRRLTSVRDFFQLGSRERTAREFPLAEKWGFKMNMGLDSFSSLFEKFVNK
jgi:hypothetical protein